MKLADPVTVRMLLGWAAGAAVAVVVAALSCGSSVVTRAEASAQRLAAAEVRPAETKADAAMKHSVDLEQRIDKRLERMESKLDRALEGR